MKNNLILCFIFFSTIANSQININQSEKYKQAGLVWGLLKYHHPEISKGKYNWDLEFIKLCGTIENIATQEQLNDVLLSFVTRFKGNISKNNKTKSNPNLFLKNVDYSWIDTDVFGEGLTTELSAIKDNTTIGDYYAASDKFSKIVSFKNEKGFNTFNSSEKSHRLLVLYSFWNVIQYWNVNKYLTDEKWINVLNVLSDDFIKSKTALEFEIAKSKLITKINDSHAFYCSQIVNDSLLRYKPAFSVKRVNDSLVVDGLINKQLCVKDNIELGDVVTKINNKTVLDLQQEKLGPLLSVSNINFFKKWGRWLLFSKNDTIEIEVLKKDGTALKKYVHLYDKYQSSEPSFLNKKQTDKWNFIKPNIAYINLSEITSKELSVVFKEISSTKGLILDLRNYPKFITEKDIPEFIYPQKKEFVKVLFPLQNSPSLGEYNGSAPLKIISDPFKAGKENPDYYKGKVVLLVNHFTQSKAEYIGMAIQQAPNCITIGEQTAGSVMNIVSFMMPDTTEVNFTALGAFYPNGKEVQRNGLHIDHLIQESAKKYDYELYIKQAVRIIENNNN